MFEERDYESSKKSDTKLPPYLVDLHSGPKKQSPYEWIINGGRDSRTKEDINYEVSPIKFFFCAKHENSGKIESHLWFFKGFCNYTNPQYCQMIDAGTIPLRESISQIVRYMDEYPQTGGACGEIEVFQPSDRELGYGYVKVTDSLIINKLDAKYEKKKVNKYGKYQRRDVGIWYERKRRG